MLERVIRQSIQRRWVIVAATIAMALLGIYNFNRLPIDAVPDITNVQVQVNTEAPGLSPLEVEQQVTARIEMAMGGIPGVDYMRSLSRYGLSQVTIVFRDGTDIYFARQLVSERLREGAEDLPPGIGQPAMGPIATGLGEIYMWAVEAEPGAQRPDGHPYTSTDLREMQDWIVKPQLRTVPGVTEVNSIGGYEKQYHVTPDPAKLVAHGLTFRDVLNALSANNPNAGADTSNTSASSIWCGSPARSRRLNDIEKILVTVDRWRPGPDSRRRDRGRRATSCAPARQRRTARRWSSAPRSC